MAWPYRRDSLLRCVYHLTPTHPASDGHHIYGCLQRLTPAAARCCAPLRRRLAAKRPAGRFPRHSPRIWECDHSKSNIQADKQIRLSVAGPAPYLDCLGYRSFVFIGQDLRRIDVLQHATATYQHDCFVAIAAGAIGQAVGGTALARVRYGSR